MQLLEQPAGSFGEVDVHDECAPENDQGVGEDRRFRRRVRTPP